MESSKFSADQIKSEFEEKHPHYIKLCSELTTQLHELISEAEVTTSFPIEYRVKTWKSIYEKCERNNLCPNELGDIPDIAGLRIILLFNRDLEKICEIIDENFEILYREDTRKRLGDDQFGYGSVHYHLTLPENWFDVPVLRNLRGLQAEVQVRTASQHIWAAASHIMQYKKEKDVPISLRRSINRVAALLETVDLEFERVLNERGEYIGQIETIDENETLNTDSLRYLLDKVLPEKNKSGQENYAELLQEIRHFNITTMKELDDIIKRNWENVSEEEAEYISISQTELENGEELSGTTEERILKGVYFNHEGLVRNVLNSEFGTEFSDYIETSTLKED